MFRLLWTLELIKWSIDAKVNFRLIRSYLASFFLPLECEEQRELFLENLEELQWQELLETCLKRGFAKEEPASEKVIIHWHVHCFAHVFMFFQGFFPCFSSLFVDVPLGFESSRGTCACRRPSA